ncbi:thioredoxin-like domain-containing protein [Flavobacterium sp.]|uniref:TlpA family protein disulfide reductase n=1 Tax=Flavobacterium sp. TaxID=239 RepID=UPI00286DEEFC|nr:thioredoxin-like domain-containing protein [Flavobacterium sp.]
MVAYFRKLYFTPSIIAILSLISCNKVFNEDKNVAYFGGEIINPNSKFVLLCKDNEVIDTIVLDHKNRFLQRYDSLSPGMYTFKHEPEYQNIYFDKNDSLMIRLNTNEFDNSLTFCGRGDEKNNFLMELFLKNEEDKNASFGIYDYDFKTFSTTIEKGYESKKAYYTRKKIDINWNDDFDLYAKTMLDMPHLSKKESYPFAHKSRTGEDICKNLPKNYYDFRKEINFNNEKLTTFSPFVRYLTSMLNNFSCKEHDPKTLENNIKKLNVVDSIFTNKKIRNTMLNNIAFMYLLEDQNMMNNKQFLDQYFALSTDIEKQKEIKKIEQSIKFLAPNKKLPKVDLIDINGKSIDINSIITTKTVVYFCSTEAKSHLELSHKRASELHKKHPDWNFISINIDDSSSKWKEELSKYKFTNSTELHASNFEEIKDKWVITKIHRAMLLHKDGTINNGFVSLFDVNFEQKLN